MLHRENAKLDGKNTPDMPAMMIHGDGLNLLVKRQIELRPSKKRNKQKPAIRFKIDTPKNKEDLTSEENSK